MILSQNAANSPDHHLNSPINCEYSYNRNYSQEYFKSIDQKIYDILADKNTSNSKLANSYFAPSYVSHWENFLINYINKSKNIKTHAIDKLLISFFNFNKYIEITNLDIHYLWYVSTLLDTLNYSESDISPECLLAHLIKSTLTYSKCFEKNFPASQKNIDKNIKKYFNVSEDELEKCNKILPEASIVSRCKEMSHYDYLSYSSVTNRFSPRQITEFKYPGVEEILGDQNRSVDIVQDFIAHDMTYLETDNTFFKIFTQPHTYPEVIKLVNDILDYSDLPTSARSYHKFLLINKFEQLDNFAKFKSVEINNAQIYLKRLIESNGIPKKSNSLLLFIELLSLSMSIRRNIPLNTVQNDLAYVADLKNLVSLKLMSQNILEHISCTSKALFEISYTEYINHLKSSYPKR